VLQAPHIAEADDAAMTRMEREMSDLVRSATAALGELSRLLEPNAPTALATAQTAFDEFKSVSDQLIPLSRRNSNVRSLELSLRAKPTFSAQCEESLRALQGALDKAGSHATR
jgi:hypothetical protein